MFAIDKPYLKKLLQKHKNFLHKCYSSKSHKARKTIIEKAHLFELNVLLRSFFLIVHHHIELRKKITTVAKKFLLKHFLKKEDFHQLLYSSQENKKIVLLKLSASFSKLLSPLFENHE